MRNIINGICFLVAFFFLGCVASTEPPPERQALDLDLIGDWYSTPRGLVPVDGGSMARVEGACALEVEIDTGAARPDTLDRWGVTLFDGGSGPATYADDGGELGRAVMTVESRGTCHALILAPASPTAADVLVGAFSLEPDQP